MKRITAPLLIICTLLLNLLAGCDGLDENYSTNPNHRFEFLDRYLIIRYCLYHDRFSHKTIHGLQQKQ